MVRASTNDTVSCPYCRNDVDIEQIDEEWSAEEAVDAMLEESDIDFVEDQHASGTPPLSTSNHNLRSRGILPEGRTLRSGKVSIVT
jgi:hypothetical protein